MHFIKKQVIELKLNKKADAFRMQHLMSKHYYDEMVPLLDDIFNEFCGDNEVVVLDKLEIDFGIILEKDLEKNRLNERDLSKFKIKLKESLAALSTGKTLVRESLSTNNCRQWIFYMQHGYLNWNTLVLNEQWYSNVLETLAIDYTGITLLRKLILNEPNIGYRIAMQHDDIFLTKLTEILTAKSQKQLLPAIEEAYHVLGKIKTSRQELPGINIFKKALWQKIIMIAATAAKDLFTVSIMETVLRPYASQLPTAKRRQQALLSSVKVIRDVLVKLFIWQGDDKKGTIKPDAEAGIVSDALVGEKDKETPSGDTKIVEAIANKKTGSVNKDENINIAENREAKTIMGDKPVREKNKETASEDKTTDETVANKKTGKQSDKMNSEDYKNNKLIQKDKAARKNKTRERPVEGKAGPVSKKDNAKQEMSDISLREDEIIKGIVDTSLLKDKQGNKKESIQPQQITETIPGEGIFVRNAGVVLTHPFIGSLFKRLKLIQDGQFIDADAQTKAIFLLHYLATGKTTADEYGLVVCKFLCSYSINEPLPGEIKFTDAELAEATDMLTALIQQWDKLQNTSIAGLRESFLQRAGKLFIKNDSPYVQVESSSIDVLLDYLPWNLSMIKLPWMKELLRVEWR